MSRKRIKVRLSSEAEEDEGEVNKDVHPKKRMKNKQEIQNKVHNFKNCEIKHN